MKTDKKNKLSDIFAAIVIAIIVIVVVAVLGFIVMILWNFLMPEIILCDKISFFQSLLLIVLVSILTYDKKILFSWLYE